MQLHMCRHTYTQRDQWSRLGGDLTVQLGLVLRDLLSADLHFGQASEKVCRIDEKSWVEILANQWNLATFSCCLRCWAAHNLMQEYYQSRSSFFFFFFKFITKKSLVPVCHRLCNPSYRIDQFWQWCIGVFLRFLRFCIVYSMVIKSKEEFWLQLL